MYSPEILDHFEHPRNAGELNSPDACAELENPACGDVLKLTLRFSQGFITEARFLAQGCVPVMACGSALTELIQGLRIDEAQNLQTSDLVARVGGLPQASTHASHLAIDTLRAALLKIKPLDSSS